MKKSLGCISIVLGLFTLPALGAHQTIDEVMIAHFNQVDVDGNGYLSKNEVKIRTSATRGLYVSQYGGFELADVNYDGKLDLAEFAAYEEDLPVE